jgi:phenylalanyl-tRNA synthetase beta chain
MLISIDWIKEFVDIPNMTPKKLGELFTLATAEVEEVITSGEFWEQITVAEVVNIERHPDAEKLNLVTFKVSHADTKRVVCGASNVKVGMKTPFAPIGVTLPVGFTLEPKKIRGILSEGMLCSEEELGLSESSSGIMDLDQSAVVGTTMLDLLKQKKEVLFDVDNKSLTHRPDLWGHMGQAREFATIFETELKDPYTPSWQKNLESKIGESSESPKKIKVNKETACLGYYGLSVNNVTVGESPKWMQDRLNALGMRPINNIVDISNYVMLELGVPLHIFDRDKISGDVCIEMVDKTTKFSTLDEIERDLVPGDTVISDNNGPLVIAGIMGGLSSGVSSDTKNIFIETANWKAAMVRKTSTRLGLRTDSSQRYEKSLDTQMLPKTLLRTLELVLECSPKATVCGGLESDGVVAGILPELKINTSVEKINKVLGHDNKEEKIVWILTSLGFQVKNTNGNLEVTVPSYRATKDVEFESDIIEEIGRIVGYDNIKSTSPKLDVLPQGLTNHRQLHQKLKNFMVYNSRALEVQTYPLVGLKLYKNASWPVEDMIKIKNSLSKDCDYMRTSLIPNFLELAGKNAKNFSNYRCFEIGRAYKADKKKFSSEDNHLIIGFYSQEKTPFMELANSVEELLQECDLPAQVVTKNSKFNDNLLPKDWKGTHPYEFLHIRIMGKMKGVITSIHPQVLKSFKVKGHLSLAIIDLSSFENMEQKTKISYSPLQKYPGSTFDCTVMAKADDPLESILASVKKNSVKYLTTLKVVDVYKLNEEEKTVTLRAHFLNPEATLKSEELSLGQESIVGALAKKGHPLKGA